METTSANESKPPIIPVPTTRQRQEQRKNSSSRLNHTAGSPRNPSSPPPAHAIHAHHPVPNSEQWRTQFKSACIDRARQDRQRLLDLRRNHSMQDLEDDAEEKPEDTVDEFEYALQKRFINEVVQSEWNAWLRKQMEGTEKVDVADTPMQQGIWVESVSEEVRKKLGQAFWKPIRKNSSS